MSLHQSAELHLHFQGCIQPSDLLDHLARARNIDWEWYEETYKDTYGTASPAKSIVERFKNGDQSAITEFKKIAVFTENDAGNFNRFLAKSNLFWAGAYRNNNQTDNDHELLGFATAIRDNYLRQGIAYAEFRQSNVSPTLLRFFNDDTSNITMRLAASLSRNDPWAEWEKVKEMALGKHGASLTAIDFCGVEEGHPPKYLTELFDAVKTFNKNNPERALAILYHVGESFSDKSLESAIRWVQEAAEMGSHRLGHAIALGVNPNMYGEHTRKEVVSERIDQINYDLKHQIGLRRFGVNIDVDSLHKELRTLATLPSNSFVEMHYDTAALENIRRRQGYAIERVRASGAIVETCPTSNLCTAGITDPAYHPIHRFVTENLPIVISSDDPGMFGVTLDDELRWAVENINGYNVTKETLLANAYQFRSEVLSGREKLTDPV